MRNNNQEDRIPILSFFSGGGFLDMGFEKAGFQVVFSNEIDKDFAQFYKEGMSSWAQEKREINAICSIDDLSANQLQTYTSKPFGIIGGPPCQDFSIQGSKAGFDGLRGTLTYHFYEKIMDLQPDFFLMENVPGLVLLKKTKSAFQDILNLYKEEYVISYTRLNSLHFGVPQSRERLFVFGLKKSLKQQSKVNSFTWPEPIYPNAENSYHWGEPNGRPIKTSQGPLPPKELCVDSILLSKTNDPNIANSEDFFQLKKLEKIKKILEGDTYRPSFKRLHREKFSPTVCYGNNEVHLHPVENRRLTVREALRLQGIPDSYIISTPGNLTKKFKMIGNGVPMPLAHQIALQIKKNISPFLETEIKNASSLQEISV